LPRSESSTILIPADIHAAMLAHCRRDDPLECCGMLAGTPPLVTAIYGFRNELASENRYSADPRDLIRAYQYLRLRKLQMVALYHSHPRWRAVPSKTDLKFNGYGDLPQIIVSLNEPTPEVRAWRYGTETYEELTWSIVPAPTGVEDWGPTD
jgi:proteasome lid subunit RPN8/RPN11